MAISVLQKIRLALRGWSRRRQEKEQEFLRANAWGTGGQAPSPVRTGEGARPPRSIDLDGLHAAYLDGSGQIAYYLDVASGEVVEHRDGTVVDAARFKRVPAASNTDVAERRAFIATLQPSATRDLLVKSVNTAAFRTALASDRTAERAWYNFRNDRAIAAIDAWLKQLGLR